MSISRSRLDRFISQQSNLPRKAVRLLLAQKRILVDGIVAENIAQPIDKFSHIQLDDEILQANKPTYIMLHKPVGVVCATKDKQHKTVIDLLHCQHKDDLHIVGRLDLNTSGLVLLTNDSRWSEQLTSPQHKVEKRYLVTLKNPLTAEYIDAFAQGMYFDYEKITTQPVKLTILSTYQAEVILTEGRYHQIKRMFGRFRNPVMALHRIAIGSFVLDNTLKVGESKACFF
ncbi:MAG: pseudouridine synthase [Colwellia sp.]